MQLMKPHVTFHTPELLKSMREVSQYQIHRLRGLGHLPRHAAVSEGTTSFSLGRQAGHTEAMVKLAIEDAVKGSNTIIVTHNRAMEKMVFSLVKTFGGDFADFTGHVIIVSISSSEVNGVGRRFPSISSRRGMASIDHIMIDGPVTHMPGWNDKFYDNILKYTDHEAIKSCVIVGS